MTGRPKSKDDTVELPDFGNRHPALPPSWTIDSTKLFAGCRNIGIRHGEEVYSLRLTRNNRLILTK